MGKATVIELSEDERKVLVSWVRSGTTQQRLVERAQIIPACAAGKGTLVIASEMKTRPAP